jgi:hypothetical protein
MPDAVDTVVCAPDDGWKYHPKRLEQFADINKPCNVASCWIDIGILLVAHPILHISRIKVNTNATHWADSKPFHSTSHPVSLTPVAILYPICSSVY